MRLGVQWTLATPGDWQWVDHREWPTLPRKPVPVGGELIDHQPGWVFALNCQGIVIGGYDHYAVEHVVDPDWGDGVRLTMWQDDPTDFPQGTRWATVWELFDPAPDVAYGGAVNTRQRRVVSAEPGSGHPALRDGTHLPWGQFRAAHESLTAHGVWVPAEHFDAHRAAASPRNWREWIV